MHCDITAASKRRSDSSGASRSTHLDVRQTHDPCSQLSGEAQGVQDYERRVSKPLQHRGAHARDAQGIERVSDAGRHLGWAHDVYEQRSTPASNVTENGSTPTAKH